MDLQGDALFLQLEISAAQMRHDPFFEEE